MNGEIVLEAIDTAKKITLRKSAILANALLFILIIVAIIHFKEEQHLFILVQHIQFSWLLLVVFLQISTYVCIGALWQLVLHQFDKRTSLKELTILSVERVFVDQVIPTLGLGGNFAVMNSLLKRNTTRGEALAAVIVEVITYYGAYFILFLVATILLWVGHDFSTIIEYLTLSFLIILVLLVALLVLFVVNTKKYHLPQWLLRIRFIQGLIEAIEEAPHETLLLKRLWFGGLLFQSLMFLFDAMTLWALFQSLGISLTLIQALESFMLASAVGTVSSIPGGLGFFEGSAVGILYVFGIPFPEAATGILLFRGFTYWLPMLPGFFIFRSELQRAPSHAVHAA